MNLSYEKGSDFDIPGFDNKLALLKHELLSRVMHCGAMTCLFETTAEYEY